ncbi:hypothetical protein CVT25_003660 [Psilocybe cyanescens]|uniref:Uncharacterized protein n=1 Tax=Psilocybe cyanescens TaxID=93625 RepID=A0A409WP94_PSICY|nr:hypothetical protein CVT25_003660 [Psilocybe cyanescens]
MPGKASAHNTSTSKSEPSQASTLQLLDRHTRYSSTWFLGRPWTYIVAGNPDRYTIIRDASANDLHQLHFTTVREELALDSFEGIDCLSNMVLAEIIGRSTAQVLENDKIDDSTKTSHEIKGLDMKRRGYYRLSK